MAFIPPRDVKGDQTLPSQVDVVVIGGGIVGVAATLSLTERGIRVALCEKGAIGAEQSSRNWGWTRQMGRDPAEIPLIIRSIRAWSEMRARIGEDVGFRRTGATYLCRSERQLAEYEAWMPLAREHDIATRLIGTAELPSFLPGITNRFTGALHTATDGVAEPQLAAPALAEAARRHGAHVLTSCAVRGVETRGGRISGVVTERGEIACENVVLAGGSWSRLFAGNLGVSVPQLKILGTAARIDAPSGRVPAMPVGADNFAFRIRADGGYTIARRNANIAPITPDSFRLFGDFAPMLVKSWKELRLRIGKEFIDGWRMPRRWNADDVSPFEHIRVLDPRPLSRLNREAVRHLVAAFPAFETSQISHEWAGLIDVTPDAVPIIGPVAQLPGFYLATGFSGHGFGLGPGAGELVADMVSGGTPCVDPHPFRFERFGTSSAQQTQDGAATAGIRGAPDQSSP